MSRPGLGLLILGVLAACSKGPPPHKPGDEFLKALKFEGNDKLKQKQLETGLALKRAQKRGHAPDPYLVQVDRDRIRGEYLRNGYLGVDVTARVERAGDAATVIYLIEEGVRATTKVVISGIPEDAGLAVSAIRAKLPIRDGSMFDYAKYDLAKPELINVVKDAGYAHAKLDALVYADRANHEAIIELDYTLGPKCTFGTIQISGVKGDLAEAVRARLHFAQGDQYSTSAITATQRALYGLARFSTVQVQAAETRGPTINMTIAVTESPRHEIKLGGGFGIDPTAYETRARAGYTVVGWPFSLHTSSLDLRPAYARLRDGSGYEPRVRAVARLERQDLFWTYAKGELEGGYNYLTVEAYTSFGPRARVGFSTPLGSDKLTARVGWGVERLEFRNISPLIDDALRMELRLDEIQRVGTYQQSVILDLRDNQIETRRGIYAELRVIEGTVAALGNYNYVQVVPELRGFLPLGKTVLASRVRAGAFYGDVPATERFFSGGSSNHRGFGERQLSPYVSGDVDGTAREVPFGGAAMIEAGIESRFPLTTWKTIPFGGVLFLDGGDVTREASELDPLNLHWAIGVGLRALTIVGPVRFDVAYRLNRLGPLEPAPGARFAFHLTLGEAF